VYLRLSRGQTVADMSPEELEDCCQLVKANSIEGHKKSSVAIVYTPWANLRKTDDMDVGQVGFRSEADVFKVHGTVARNAEVLNRLQKTREERRPNLATEKEAWEAEERAIRREAERVRRKVEQEASREQRKAAEERSYDRLMVVDSMVTNAEVAARYASVEDAEEDFM